MKTVLAVFMLLFALLLSVPAHAQSTAPSDNLFVVVQHGLYGYIDHDGKMLVQPQFLWAADFENGYGVVYVCGRYALINKSGTVLPFETPHWSPSPREKIVGSKIGFVDNDGVLTIKPVFDEVLPFSDGVAAVRVGSVWGFIDTTGRYVIAPRYDAAFYFREGVGQVDLDDVTLLIDKSGKVIASGYDTITGLTAEGRIPVGRDDKYGYLDLTGAVVIPLQFDQAGTFSEGLAPVRNGSKWGYIDKNGKIVIPFKFDSADEFGNGLAPVKLGNDSGFIDHTGFFHFRLAFKQATGFWFADSVTDVSRFWTKDDDFGLVNTSGKVIWGPIQESPDHAPILGWSEEENRASCNVLPEPVRKAVLAFPPEHDE